MADPLLLHPFYQALSALARAYQLRDRSTLLAEGVTVTECYALEAVIRDPGCSVTAVARELGLNKSSASRAILALERRGLLRRAEDPKEHRAVRLEPTARGRARHRRVVTRVAAEYRGLLSSISPARRRQLVDTLERLAELTRKRLAR